MKIRTAFQTPQTWKGRKNVITGQANMIYEQTIQTNVMSYSFSNYSNGFLSNVIAYQSVLEKVVSHSRILKYIKTIYVLTTVSKSRS